MAFLRLFDPDDGVKDIPIPGKRFILGRSPEYADFCIHDAAVSRMHAMIYESAGQSAGHFTIKDMDSTSGTLINNRQISEHKLRSGDKIQLGNTSLEFIMKPENEVEKDDNKISSERTICGIGQRFKPIPAGMGLNVRILYMPPTKIFNSGDTLIIGSGGLRITCPVEDVPVDTVLEVELAWPSGSKKIFLGEVVQIYNHQMFVMLHKIAEDRHKEILESCKRGSWLTVCKPS